MNDVSTQIPVAEQFYSVQGEQDFNALCPKQLFMGQYDCDDCGREFGSRQALAGHARGSCSPDNRVVVECERCGEEKKMWPSEMKNREKTFCSVECRSQWISETKSGENSPRYKRVTVGCDVCGETKEMWPSQADEYDHHFCSDECENTWRSENFKKEQNPVWAGGYEPFYGSNWRKKRREVVERDGDECRVCGITADEYGRSIDVHHIESVTSFDKPEKANTLDNMIQLCPTCHTQAEHDKIKVPEP